MKYVLGFMFSEDHRQVALIRKARPGWQKGKFNAPGGKVEPGEAPLDATQGSTGFSQVRCGNQLR